jgi:glycosyltransferase involved in cell wall biosynthesis
VARILILSIYHDPEPIPKTGELARELQRRGHEVTVVTAFPHYPSGRLYPGYALALWRWETVKGVRVLRTFIYPYHGRRSSLRILNYLSWMASSIQAAWLAPRCDVMYVWHPPLTVGISAWVIARLKRVRYVYDVQDLWPESALASGLMRPGLLVTVLHRLADWVYRRAPAIFVVSEAAAAHLVARGVDRSKISVARHWIDTSPFERPATRERRAGLGWGSKFVVMFAGNLGFVQGLDTVIGAAALLRDRPEIEFVLVGDGADRGRLEAMVDEKRLDNVRFLGYHPPEEMPALLRAADALLVHLRRSDIAEHAVPTKILSYMAAARPIVCATTGAAAELVQTAGAGLTTAPDDPAGLAAAVVRLASMSPEARDRMGRDGRAYLDAHFDKQTVISQYEHALLDMAAAGPARAMRSEGRA